MSELNGAAKKVKPPKRPAAPEPPKPVEKVHHPAHYGGGENPYEAIKVIEAYLTPDRFAGFLIGTIMRYQMRAGRKGDEITDHKKVKWYSDYLIRYLERHPELCDMAGPVLTKAGLS